MAASVADPADDRVHLLPAVVWLLYVVRPDWSYRLNADFEDHAEHEYMELVAEHPEWETVPWVERRSPTTTARFASRADLFRQIGYDERVHKQESEQAMPPDGAGPMSIQEQAACAR